MLCLLDPDQQSKWLFTPMKLVTGHRKLSWCKHGRSKGAYQRKLPKPPKCGPCPAGSSRISHRCLFTCRDVQACSSWLATFRTTGRHTNRRGQWMLDPNPLQNKINEVEAIICFVPLSRIRRPHTLHKNPEKVELSYQVWTGKMKQNAHFKDFRTCLLSNSST